MNLESFKVFTPQYVYFEILIEEQCNNCVIWWC